MKILVVKRDKIGDLLLTTPLITHLARAVPDAEVHVLANDYNGWVLHGHPDVARLWTYPRVRHGGRARFAAVLRQARQFVELWRERFDIAVAAGGEESPRAIRRALAVRAARTIAYAAVAQRYGRRLTDVLPPPAAGHEAARMLALASPLRIASPAVPPEVRFEPLPAWREQALAWLAREGLAPGRFVVVGLGARDPEKQPTRDQVLRWAARLDREHGFSTVLQYTPGDAGNPLYPGSEALARGIAAQAGTNLRLLPEGLPLAVGAIVAARTSLLPDGGLMHIAASSPGGVVGLFASPDRLSAPERWGPLGRRASVLCAPRAVADLADDTVFSALAPRLAPAP